MAEGVTGLDDWEWTKQFRYYRPNETSVTANMAGAVLDYSWEYQGNAPKLVHTPLTDKCYLILTQVCLNCGHCDTNMNTDAGMGFFLCRCLAVVQVVKDSYALP